MADEQMEFDIRLKILIQFLFNLLHAEHYFMHHVNFKWIWFKYNVEVGHRK